MNSATRDAISAVWHLESAKLIGALVRLVRDVALAEDLAQEALLSAFEKWPETGLPHNPGAWLMAAARNRAIDHFRRQKMLDAKHIDLTHDEASQRVRDIEAAIDDNVGDDVLRLLLISCHPVLSKDARVALTLRLLGGLSTDEIARAFLQPEPTIAQRIVRAKRTLTEARVPFEVPRGADLSQRLASVCEVIYLVFNEGYAATAGDDWMRPELCDEAMRLGRVLLQLVPSEAEVHALVSLMELTSSRTPARTTDTGEPILLLDQDRARWDQQLIQRGLATLDQANTLQTTAGPYALQAGIAACHARARSMTDTNWERIVALYDGLVELTQSPVVALNRAVAVGMAFGPAEGLELVDELVEEPELKAYHLLWSARGDLLAKLGRSDEARKEFQRAASMTTNMREREVLLARANSPWNKKT